ncbi:MAG: PASTA domain-containing protein, partial [Clostridium sp.]|nr:PASTA domain-containing protein [Clostridium sp.]
VYSLGITMFEMLTGRVPFNGETTVAIAIKHIQEQMPSPRDYVSEIPVSVEQIVFKCCQKSPDRRYQTMGELIADLKRSLMTPDEDFVRMVDPDEDGSTKMISSDERQKIKRQRAAHDGMEEAMHLRKEADVKKSAKKRYVPEEEDEEEEDEAEYEYDEEEEEEDEDEDYDPGMERITTILAVAAAILIGCIVLFLVGKAFGIFDGSLFGKQEESSEEEEEEKEKVEMIEVVGKNADEVKVALLELGLTPEIEYEENAEYEQGIVMRCSVDAGEMIEEGSNVLLTVSAGSEGVPVPDVVGMSEAEAAAALGKGGFPVNKTQGHDPYIKEGNIVTQSPEAGAKVPAGTTVTIRVSQGPEVNKVQVPDVIGKDEAEGMAILVEAGLQMGKVDEVNHSDPAMAGLICYQSYSVGDYVDAGTIVDVSISIGPEEATYQFLDSIAAPTPEEDPNYHSGTMVTVTLMADDGTQLYSTQTSSFPIAPPGVSGIKSPTGYILFQYVNTVETPITLDDGNVDSTVINENKEFRRPVQFMEN